MKIEIDTINKTIKVEEQVNFCELNRELKKMLGDNLKDYVVLPHANIITTYPVYVERWPQPNVPYWSVQPYLTPSYPSDMPTTITCNIGPSHLKSYLG